MQHILRNFCNSKCDNKVDKWIFLQSKPLEGKVNRKQNCSNKLKAEGRSLLDVTHPYITHNEGDLCHMKQLRCESIFLSDWL